MSGLTEEINSQDEAIAYAQANPNKALGLVIWNMMLMQKQCACRLSACKADQKRGRLKNMAMQMSGGVIGGATAAYGIWLAAEKYIIAALKEYVGK